MGAWERGGIQMHRCTPPFGIPVLLEDCGYKGSDFRLSFTELHLLRADAGPTLAPHSHKKCEISRFFEKVGFVFYCPRVFRPPPPPPPQKLVFTDFDHSQHKGTPPTPLKGCGTGGGGGLTSPGFKGTLSQKMQNNRFQIAAFTLAPFRHSQSTA